MTDTPYDETYYADQGLDQDRIALWYYARLLGRLRRRGGRLLDFGCGTGHLLRRLAPRFQTYGYDLSPVARARCRRNAPNAVVVEDWRSIEPASLDVIVSLHTLEHVEQPRPLVRELSLRLVPGGLFFAVVPNPGGLGHRLKRRDWFAYRDPSHCSLLSRGEWVMILRQAGLQVRWVRGDGMWDAPYVRFLPASWQRVLFAAPAAAQVLAPLGRPFLPATLGECLLIAATRQQAKEKK